MSTSFNLLLSELNNKLTQLEQQPSNAHLIEEVESTFLSCELQLKLEPLASRDSSRESLDKLKDRYEEALRSKIMVQDPHLQKMNQATDMLYDGLDKINEAHRNVNEINDQSHAILSNLEIDRGKILSSIDKSTKIDTQIAHGERLTRSMMAREKKQRIMMYSLAALFLIVCIVMIVLKCKK